MSRVKRGKHHLIRRKHLLKHVKGYMWGRKSKIKLAKIAFLKAGSYAYRDRRNKKRDLRGLQIIKIGAATKLNGLSYSKFINNLKKANIELDRKILAVLAERHPAVFNKILDHVQG